MHRHRRVYGGVFSAVDGGLPPDVWRTTLKRIVRSRPRRVCQCVVVDVAHQPEVKVDGSVPGVALRLTWMQVLGCRPRRKCVQAAAGANLRDLR